MPPLANLNKLVQKEKIEYIDLKFCDLIGGWHHMTIPVSSLNQELFTNGVGVDGSSLPGFTKIEKGDMIVIPDTATAFVDPFFEIPTLSFICDIMAIDKEIEPYSRNPRRVAKDAERYLKKILPGTSAVLGPEFEYYLFDDVMFRQAPQELSLIHI